MLGTRTHAQRIDNQYFVRKSKIMSNFIKEVSME